MKLNKKGISLIVLVITIIVMIILATAIILSLNSSNISGKANEAKLSSDMANKKEAASVYLAEYELKVAKGKIDRNEVTADDYVKEQMLKAGLDVSDITITEDGEIIVGLANDDKTSLADKFIKAGVKIGDVVEGYKLNNMETYRTSGKENTCSADNVETNPQPDTITRDNNITWKYMGIDKNGEVLIVGSVTNSSPTIMLGGEGGYLYGPQELNDACEALYSSSMGTARSINMDDVISVIEYTGERGGYTDISRNEIRTEEAKTIEEIAKEIGYDMNNYQTQTPESGKNIGSYKADAYWISPEDATKYNSNNKDAIALIATDEIFYWLASNCVSANFNSGCSTFNVRYAFGTEGYIIVARWELVDGAYESMKKEFTIRPVVQLDPSVVMTYENGVVTLK